MYRDAATSPVRALTHSWCRWTTPRRWPTPSTVSQEIQSCGGDLDAPADIWSSRTSRAAVSGLTWSSSIGACSSNRPERSIADGVGHRRLPVRLDVSVLRGLKWRRCQRISRMLAQIIPVIMCGGAGTRLWPVSRESMPKQFVSLVGQGSTFQQVLTRISDPSLFSRPIVITNADFRFVVAEQLRELGIEADIVLEPSRRDSGPAVAVSAVLATQRDHDALVLVLAADHVVRKP